MRRLCPGPVARRAVGRSFRRRSRRESRSSVRGRTGGRPERIRSGSAGRRPGPRGRGRRRARGPRLARMAICCAGAGESSLYAMKEEGARKKGLVRLKGEDPIYAARAVFPHLTGRGVSGGCPQDTGHPPLHLRLAGRLRASGSHGTPAGARPGTGPGRVLELPALAGGVSGLDLRPGLEPGRPRPY